MNELTVNELKERIVSQVDTVDLLEYLEISIEELVEAFTDKIEDNYERLVDAIGEDEAPEETS